MRITRLSVRDFRRYRQFDVPLAPGLTIIHGPNEAGKTTIQRALELILTKKATSNTAEIDGLRSWDAPEDARPVITIDFELDDEENGVRKGTIVKEFRGAKGTVRLDVDGETITDPTLADQALAELTGIPTEAFFRSTASIRHHELADLDRDEAALRDRLQASISGADRGTSRARRKLERAIFDLSTKGAKNPGRVKVAEEAVEQERAAVEQGDLALAQLERDRDTMSGARERRAEVEGDLTERRSLLEKARQAERLTAERVAATERFERFRQAVRTSEELAELHASHPSANPLPVLEQVVARLRRLDARIRELKAALSGEVEVQFEVPPEPTWRPLSRVAIGLVLLGVILAGATFAGRLTRVLDLGTAPQLIGGAIAGIGFILAFVAFWLRRSDRMQTQLRDVEIDRRLRGRSEMEAELRQAEADTVQQLLGIGLEDLAGGGDPSRRRAGARLADRAAQRPARGARSARSPSRPCLGCATRPPSRSSRRPTPSRRSGRSPASPAPGNGSRSRSGTWKRRSSGPATTRRTPGPGSKRTSSTRRPSPPTPNAWPSGRSSSRPSSDASGSTSGPSARSSSRSRRR